ncbi:MAG: hypothetical protein AAFQ79_17610 [Pseudomonadota bacterium]
MSEDIWSRLYGPYGIRDVTSDLRQLADRWDPEVAKNLFWEELHHQDDLYPVTYAALPWIKKITDASALPDEQVPLFLSHVLYCATVELDAAVYGQGTGGKFHGLSLRVEDHAVGSPSSRLTAGDMVVLAALEDWLTASAAEIALACLSAIPADDEYLAAAYCTGFCSLQGSSNTAHALTMWGDQHPLEEIVEHVALEAKDLEVLEQLAIKVSGKNEGLYRAISDLAREVRHGPIDPQKVELPS